MTRTLRPNLDHFNARQGSLTRKAFAAQIGMNQSTLSRVLDGSSEPGPRFIAAVLLTLEHDFTHFFDVVEELE